MAARTPSGSSPAGRRAARGFALVLLLVLIAVLAAVSAWTVSIGHRVARQQAELELLAIGTDFRAALISYGGGTIGGPAELADLLRDPRVAGVRRHLRAIPADPLTGRFDWGLVRSANGRITGVYSLAPGEPGKRAGFEPWAAGFERAATYSDWVFSAAVLPPGGPRPATARGAPAPG